MAYLVENLCIIPIDVDLLKYYHYYSRYEHIIKHIILYMVSNNFQ
ncbi:MAG: hypothetical protein PUD53_06045 [Oscillospiraceae bacterium]|nr:hypothetical protein [Oscillospiraceae bacterium]